MQLLDTFFCGVLAKEGKEKQISSLTIRLLFVSKAVFLGCDLWL